jgi:succinate dehydrogenase hydrophobic anchor subunit
MGMILAGIAIVLFVAALVYVVLRWDNCDNEEALIGAGVGALVSGVMIGIILFMSVMSSYTNYVDIRTKYDATITQYKEAITMYKDHATIDVGKAAFTDLKYQGYQENMASFIENLRSEITNYNEMLISKRIMKKNWFFSWIIVAPDDDMKILNMSD